MQKKDALSFHQMQKFHHSFPDPAKAQGTEKEIMQQFWEVRNMIKELQRCCKTASSHYWSLLSLTPF